MTLRELQEKRAKLVADARAALDDIKANTDESRAKELEERHDKYMAELDALDRQIERERRQAAAEQREAEERARVERMRPRHGDTEAEGQADGDKITYRDAFHAMLRAGGDLAALTAEERDVLRSGYVRAEQRAQTAGTASAGGYTVPTELAGFIIKSMAMWGPMYDGDIVTEIITSGGNPFKIPTVNDTAVTAEPHTEGTPLTDDGGKDVTFGQKELSSYVYDTEFVRWSFELDQDSVFNIEQLLGELLGERLGRIANSKLTVGNGSTEPNGIVTASTLGKTAVGTTAITTDELIDLYHSVDPAYRRSPKAAFMMADSTLAAIRKLKDQDGQYIWSAGDIQKGVPATLLGCRYHINQAMPSIATKNRAILFGDFGRYYVRKVGAPVIGVMRERFWPDRGIAGLIRFDGELADTAAVKHLALA